MIRLGVICSSGGAVFGQALRLLRQCGLPIELAVVTDRACGAETLSAQTGTPWRRIEDPSREAFSAAAAHWLLDEMRCEWTALFFTRLVGEALHARAPCVNFHPSLLPAFRGFGALKAVLETGSRFVGATAHRVDHSTDGGPILAQVVAAVPQPATLALLERISFAQKLYLLLVVCDQVERGGIAALGHEDLDTTRTLAWASPEIQTPELAHAFDDFIAAEGIAWNR